MLTVRRGLIVCFFVVVRVVYAFHEKLAVVDLVSQGRGDELADTRCVNDTALHGSQIILLVDKTPVDAFCNPGVRIWRSCPGRDGYDGCERSGATGIVRNWNICPWRDGYDGRERLGAARFVRNWIICPCWDGYDGYE